MTDTQARRCGHCDATLLVTDAVHYPARRGEIDAGNPLLGTIVDGKYRLQSVLGRGGLGTVFRAQHIGSLVTVALKVLHPRFAERPEYRRALLPEARRAATVVDERCARLLDVGEGTDGVAYLAMELVEGQTLDEVLQQGALAPSHALDILLQICQALAAIHEVGLVHCDLSPRNVMVSARSGRLEVKVLDFGIARSMSVARREQAPGDLVGFANLAFSAPEVLLGEDVDARTDIYSLGALAWLLLTGTMPIEDRDPQTALAAAREGRLLPWPGALGVPRRLARLVQQCLQSDAELRPATVAEVHRRCLQVRTGHGGLLLRIAAVAALAAVVVLVFTLEGREPVFLQQRSGSPLRFGSEPMAATDAGVCLPASALRQVSFFYGGFVPTRLRAAISRAGRPLHSVELAPAVDHEEGSLTLSMAQPAWQSVVRGVLASSAEQPVDLALLVPGIGPLASTRLQLDDEPPSLVADWAQDVAAGVRGDARLELSVADAVGLQSVAVELELADGRRRRQVVPTDASSVAIGAQLFEWFASVHDLGAGELFVSARDRAGNQTRVGPLRFASADVAAPQVVAVSGPAGEAELMRRGGLVRGRVQLTSSEPGCRVRGRTLDRDGQLVELPLLEATGTGELQFFEFGWDRRAIGEGPLSLVVDVVDPVGNERSSAEFSLAVRSRELREVLLPRSTAAAPVVWRRDELVMGPQGGVVELTVAPPFSLHDLQFERGGELARPEALSYQATGPRTTQLTFAELEAGEHELSLRFRSAADAADGFDERRFVVRVLPAQIEIAVPSAEQRYLRGVLEVGMLAEVEAGASELREGSAWRLAEPLRRYVAGDLWVGTEVPVALPVLAGDGPLLPVVAPVAGRNVLALALRDVLDRPVMLIDAAGEELALRDGRYVIADFWWSSNEPQQVDTPLLVEHARLARFRVRLPVPFLPSERDQLRVRMVGTEVAAAVVEGIDERSCEVRFDVEFAVWSVAADFTGKTREDYANSLVGAIEATVTTPAADYRLTLRVKTTRSNLSPLTLGELAAEVPAALASIRLLPVLAPDGAFVEPVPPADLAPPRRMYRPQVAVDVRNMVDIMLQDRELLWGEARALQVVAAGLDGDEPRRRCVHFEDPRGLQRLRAAHLLPDRPAPAPDDAVLTGVDFYQAYALTRLLGLAVAEDVELFRLPFGCELELAAFGARGGQHGSGAMAHGGRVPVDSFAFAGAFGSQWTTDRSVAAGDLVPSGYGDHQFLGLDFGVREWVFDIPHAAGADVLLREWIGDHTVHLRRQMDIARGVKVPGRDPVGRLRQFGVVRGLSFAEKGELIDASGTPLQAGRYGSLPASVPGVLRTEQLRCDGSSLLQGAAVRDPRLRFTGLRVAADAARVARLWGGK